MTPLQKLKLLKRFNALAHLAQDLIHRDSRTFTQIASLLQALQTFNESESADGQRQYPLLDSDESLDPNLLRSVDELEFSVRAANCLQNINIELLGELVQCTKADLLNVPGLGPITLREIENMLSEIGLRLGITLPKKLRDQIPKPRIFAILPQ